MGDSRADNGGGWPSDDSFDGLPDLPPEWGVIVIPDDASELDMEAYALRRELRRDARRAAGGSRWWGRRSGSHGRPAGWPRFGRLAADQGSPPVGVPLVIMAVAILTTMISLFVVTWGRQGTTPTAVATQGHTATVGITTGAASPDLLAIVLRDDAGRSIKIGPLLPAVLLLLDSCNCPGLVREVAAAVPAGVRVLAIGTTAPVVPNQPANVLSLADPDGRLRGQYPSGTGPSGSGATALVVDHTGAIVVTVPGVTTARDLPAIDAAKLS